MADNPDPQNVAPQDGPPQNNEAPGQLPADARSLRDDEPQEEVGTVGLEEHRLDTSNTSTRRSARQSSRTEQFRRRAAARERAEQDRQLKELRVRELRRKVEANDAIVAAEQAAVAAAQTAERMKRKAREMDDLAREKGELREMNATAAVEDAEERMANCADSLYEEEESLDESEEDAQYRGLEEEYRRKRGGPLWQRADPEVGPAPEGKASIPVTALPEPGRARSPSPINHPGTRRERRSLSDVQPVSWLRPELLNLA